MRLIKVPIMDVNKMINVLSGMIHASANPPKTDEWVKDFLVEIKTLIEEQQTEIIKLRTERDIEGKRQDIVDKKGETVSVGDVIRFPYALDITYPVVSEAGYLGCYEDGRFIRLHDVLKNFEIIGRL